MIPQKNEPRFWPKPRESEPRGGAVYTGTAWERDGRGRYKVERLNHHTSLFRALNLHRRKETSHRYKTNSKEIACL